MSIAITGSTGHLGRLVVSKLKSKLGSASGIVALARDAAKAADLGVEARAANYEDPASLETALAGVETLLLISSNEMGRRAAQHTNAIQAAQRAGVQRIVYTSILHADTSPISLAREHLDTENALKASGIAYTILRNGWYTENYTSSIGGALAGGASIGSAGEGKVSWAARADYADAAVAVLTTAGHEGKTYELAGDTAHTLSELAAEISQQTGKTIPYKNLSAEEYATTLAGFGLPVPIAQAIASWDVDASNGALFDDSRQLSALIGHPTASLRASVAEALSGLA